MYPVRLEIKQELSDSIKNIKENLRLIPNKGIGYGALFRYQKNSLPKITFNYLGQFDKEANNKQLWNITGERSGIQIDQNNEDFNILNINGLVIDGKLSFSISSKLDQQITDKFTNEFKENLINIIRYCTTKNTIEYTISDFNDFEPYVEFNKITKQSRSGTLFIFPPGNAGAESYFNNIVPQLQNKHLVLFNNYHLYLQNKFGIDKTDYITYEYLATEYIRYIKSIQSNGPYNLCGWSFGGVLAFEIARQMIAKCDTVANILLIDSFFDYKKAVSKINRKPFKLDNINIMYSPFVDNSKLLTNIILFKALQIPKTQENNMRAKFMNKIYEYYVKNTNFNNLEYILTNKKFKLIGINDSHESWVHNKNEVTKICDEIVKLY